MNFNPELSNTTKPEEAPTPAINLDRDTPLESGLEYNPNFYYRIIGESGYNDFLETGEFRAAQNTKQDYDKVYYFQGHPLARYARGVNDVFFLEVDPDGEELFSNQDKYRHSLRNINKKDKIRIYKVSVVDKTIKKLFSNF